MPDHNPLMGQLLLQIALIMVNALFACAEIAVISMNDNRLAKMKAAGDRRAIRLSRLTRQPARFLATIQVGITLAGFMASAFAASNFSSRLTDWLVDRGASIPAQTLNTLSVVAITLILSYFTLVFGELVPKRVAMRMADRLALALSGIIYVLSRIFAPVVWVLTASTHGVLRLLRINPNAEDDEVTEEEIRMMVDAGSEKGAIDPEEKDMIQNIFEFDDKNAGEIMTHRTEVSLLWLEESDEQWRNTLINSRHSVYPVCGDTADQVAGVLYAKDYFRLRDTSRASVMKQAVRPAYFVPETVRADVLFRNMKAKRVHFAVVLDEHGGMGGIITMYDLLEQLVGDLEDDLSAPKEPPLIESLDSRTWRIRGAAPLEEVSERLGVLLPENEYETFGGMVFGLLGAIPDEGSTPELEAFGMVIRVNRVREHRLESAAVYLAHEGERPLVP